MKTLPSENYIVQPFNAYKGQQHSFEYLSGNDPYPFYVNEAIQHPEGWQWTGINEAVNPDGSYKRALYATVIQSFYPSISTVSGSPAYVATGSLRIQPLFDRMFHPSSSGNVYVLNVSADVFGERINPGSFELTTTAGTASITDDGFGRLMSSTSPTSVIGNIFYSLGVAVIKKMEVTGSFTGSVISHDGLLLTTGSDLTVDYQSQLTIYEHTAICTLETGEFNYTTNVSLNLHSSSSVSGSTRIRDAFSSGTLTPYMTTIALYNNAGELMVVGRVPKAIRRIPDMDQTFILKWDF